MFSRDQRLGKRSEILRVYRQGRKFYAAEFRLNVFRVPPTLVTADRKAGIRLAVVVPNKVSKKSTGRNTLKRRMRAAIQAMPLNSSLAADVVVTANPGTKDLTVVQISGILQTLFGSAGLFLPA